MKTKQVIALFNTARYYLKPNKNQIENQYEKKVITIIQSIKESIKKTLSNDKAFH